MEGKVVVKSDLLPENRQKIRSTVIKRDPRVQAWYVVGAPQCKGFKTYDGCPHSKNVQVRR